MSEEIWKDIPWYEWRYEASSHGRIKSLSYLWNWKEQVLKQNYNQKWYLSTSLYKNLVRGTFIVHRLIAKTFIENIHNKEEVNHINWIKDDNRIDNLEWSTRSENQLHAFKTWLQVTTENNKFRKNNPSTWRLWRDSWSARKVNQYTKEWEFIKTWWSISEVFVHLWIKAPNIVKCCKWERKTAWWYRWSYV